MDCGHAYMSNLRTSDDVTNFSSWIDKGAAKLRDEPGLGVKVDSERINKYLEDEHHGS
jgi:muconate cycloisomerase